MNYDGLVFRSYNNDLNNYLQCGISKFNYFPGHSVK